MDKLIYPKSIPSKMGDDSLYIRPKHKTCARPIQSCLPNLCRTVNTVIVYNSDLKFDEENTINARVRAALGFSALISDSDGTLYTRVFNGDNKIEFVPWKKTTINPLNEEDYIKGSYFAAEYLGISCKNLEKLVGNYWLTPESSSGALLFNLFQLNEIKGALKKGKTLYKSKAAKNKKKNHSPRENGLAKEMVLI
ncbi:hypothetical protein ACFL6I_09200 [candidate division KSB1 bacterium]